MKIANCKLQNEASGHSARRAEILPSVPARRDLLPSGGRRRAFTLVELLVVIAILSIVTVASIPFIVPALSSRAVREAARIVNTQFATAQAQAMATGRSVGVWMERLPGEPTGSMDLYLAEVPPAYAGQDVNETVTVNVGASPATVTFANAAFFPLLRPGDLIRFNNSGPYYVLGEDPTQTSKPDPNDPSALVLTDTQTSAGPPPKWTKTIRYLPTDNHFRCPPKAYTPAGWAAPYQVFRQPVKLSTSAVQLPNGAVIDLIDSGVGNTLLYRMLPGDPPPYPGYPPNNVLSVNPSTATALQKDDDRLRLFTIDPLGATTFNNRAVVFLFNASGALESICFNLTNPNAFPGGVSRTTEPVLLTSPVYLMIGKREKVFQKTGSAYVPTYYNTSDNANTQADKHNFRDLENLWISINPQSGLASTVEVADITDSAYFGAGTAHDVLAAAVNASRKFAQSAQATGGR